MEIINLKGKIEPDEILTCPLCDQPIDYVQLAAIGGIDHEWGQSFCLIHKDCGEE